MSTLDFLFPIATLGAEGDSNVDDFCFEYQQTANFEGIYIVTKFTSNSGVDLTKLVSYEIYPNSAFPTFHRIGTAAIIASSTLLQCTFLKLLRLLPRIALCVVEVCC